MSEQVKRVINEVVDNWEIPYRHRHTLNDEEWWRLKDAIADAILKRWPDMENAALRAELELVKAELEQAETKLMLQPTIVLDEALQRELDEAKRHCRMYHTDCNYCKSTEVSRDERAKEAQ